MVRVLEGEASNYGVIPTSSLLFFHVLSGCDILSYQYLVKAKTPMTNENFLQKLQKSLFASAR